VLELFRENNRSRYDGSREGATSRFVDSGDGRDAQGAQFPFMTKSTAPIHRRKILKS